MFEKLREHSKIIVYIVVIAFGLSGAYMGFGAITGRFSEGPEPGQTPDGQDISVLARVNGYQITDFEYEQIMQQQMSQAAMMSSSEQLTFRYQVLMNIIQSHLALQEAEKRGIEAEVTDGEVQQEISQIMDMYNLESEEEFLNLLQASGFTSIDQIKEVIKAEMEEEKTLQKMIENVYADVEVSEEEVKEEYRLRFDEEAEGEHFEEEKAALENDLLQDKRNQTVMEWMQDLRSQAEITVEDNVLAGLKSLENENYGQAIINLNQAIAEQAYPEPGLYIHLARAQHREGDKEEAFATLENAAREYSDNWEILLSKGNLRMEDEELEQAEEFYDKAEQVIEKDEFMPDQHLMNAHYQLFLAYSNIGLEEKAQDHIAKVQNLYQTLLLRQQMQMDETVVPDDVSLEDLDEELIDIEIDEEEIQEQLEETPLDEEQLEDFVE